MGLDIAFKDMDGYFHVKVSGTFTKDSALATFEKVLIYSTVKKVSKILIDCREMSGEMDISELFAFSQKSEDLQVDYGDSGMITNMRTAYLFDPSVHDLGVINQGVYNKEKDDFILTVDHEEAVNWLQTFAA